MGHTIYALLVGHWLADFVFQTDWMAINKSKNWKALGFHVGVYTAVIGLIVAFVQPDSEYPYNSIKLFGLWILVNAVIHFIQDAITSRINAKLWQANERHYFFVSIGFDQLLHYITLFVTATWWLK